MFRKLKDHAIFVIVSFLIVSLAMTGMFLLKEKTGLSVYMNASAGTITELRIEQTLATTYWGGAYGIFQIDFNSELDPQVVNITNSDITSFDVTLDCFGSTGNDIYFSETWFSDLDPPFRAVNASEIEQHFNLEPSDRDSPSNTLTENITVNIGGDVIETVGTYTNQEGMSSSDHFDMFVLKDDSGNYLFGTHVIGFANAYDGSLVNYQMLIPMNVTSQEMYVYGDPISDPFGECMMPLKVFIEGWARDRYTGSYLDDVDIRLTYKNTTTEGGGYYKALVDEGSYYLIAEKEGYFDHIANINLTPGHSYIYNFSMIPTFGLTIPNGTGLVNGTVSDNETGMTLEDAFVSIGDAHNYTNASGFYGLPAFTGNKTIVAFKQDYQPYVGKVEVINLETVTYDINMTTTETKKPPTGNLTGIVLDEEDNPIPNASVSLASTMINTSTNLTGRFNLTAPEGDYFVIAERYGYKRAIEYLDIIGDNITDVTLIMEEENLPYETQTICMDTINGTPYSFEFTIGDTMNTTIVLDESRNDTCISLDIYSERPDDVGEAYFYNLGRYYSIESNVNNSIIQDVTLLLGYNESDIGNQFEEEYLVLHYFNGTDWIERDSTVYPEEDMLELQTDHLSFYMPGVRSNRIYGNVTKGGQEFANVSIYTDEHRIKSDETGSYEIKDISDGEHILIAIKKDHNAHIHFYNITPGEYISHDIMMSDYQPPGNEGDLKEESPEPGLGPGKGPGLGPGTGYDEIIVNPDAVEIYVTLSSIDKELRQGSFAEETITIFNHKQSDTEIFLNVTGDVADSVKIEPEYIHMAKNTSKDIKVRLKGNKKPGLYTGTLELRGGLNYDIPIHLDILKENKVDIKSLMLELETIDKIGYRGKKLRYRTEITNFLSDQDFFVELNYSIHLTNTSEHIPIGSEVVRPSSYLSIIKETDIPENLTKGTYILTADAKYFGYSSSARTLFDVKDQIHNYKLFGIMPVWLLGEIIGAFIFGILGYMFIRYEQNKHKRFHVHVDYKALPKPGDRSIFVGNIAETNKKAYFDMDKLTVHTIVAGSTGGGKSISSQDIVEECLKKDIGVVVFDPTAQWSGMLRKLTDKKFLSFYPNFGMNPKKDARAFPGNIKAVTDYREKVDIFKYMKAGEIQVFTTNKLDPKNYDVFVANMIRQIFHSNLEEYRGLRYLIVFDEIHRILPKFGGSGAGFTQIERGCREFRKWGMGILLISQVLSDFVGEIKANINTQVQMKTRDEGDLNRIKMQYGEEFIQELVKAPVGSGMVQNSSYNNGKPYYVTFRPIQHSVARLKDDELEKYNQFNDIVEDLEYQLEQLEQENQDVFDLKLELKLAKDKIKGGNFNMVKIYLDGLTPRIQKVWDKLGKKPKKKEIELISEEEIREDIEKAKK